MLLLLLLNITGMGDYSSSPCPPGYFCENATRSLVACPNGTYRDISGAKNIGDCFPCPAGYYCDKNATIGGVQCPSGTYCPAGTTLPTECMTGYYCNRSMTQEPCPAGYFCPNGSALPIKCPKGHYCDPRNHCYDNSSKIDAGACYPRICPLGEFDVFSYQKVIVLQFLPLRSS